MYFSWSECQGSVLLVYHPEKVLPTVPQSLGGGWKEDSQELVYYNEENARSGLRACGLKSLLNGNSLEDDTGK